MPALKATDVLMRHERIAFQFSGGKDSTAALFMLREFWPRMSVYWLNSGDAFPETAAFVHDIGAMFERFIEVPGRVAEAVAGFGIPADVIPDGCSEEAWALKINTGPLLQDRAMCCARSKIVPMHQRMIDDGITLIVRGQRADDQYKGPHASGDVVDGVELYYPIEHWSDSEVMAWLVSHDILPPLYSEGIQRSGDCMRCSAWLGDRRAEYLAKNHPAAFQDYGRRLMTICRAAEPSVARLFSESIAWQSAHEKFNRG